MCFNHVKMDIRVRNTDGMRCYHMEDMESFIKQERSIFLLDDFICSSCPHRIDHDGCYMHEDSVLIFMKWVHKKEGILRCLTIIEYVKTMQRRENKRKYSTTHRIEIAYKSKYRCNMCNILLPPTFEVDHIIELQDGGKDVYENLQALCPNCHASKSRANILRRDKAFKGVYETRFREMQCNSFDKFKHVKKSKYF